MCILGTFCVDKIIFMWYYICIETKLINLKESRGIKMSLKKASIPWKVSQISKMIDKGNISFDNIVQRSYVWEQERKSRLVESILLGYPIPSVYAKKGENEYDVLDGKQRLSALADFVSDRYSLIGLDLFLLGEEPLSDSIEYSDDELKDFDNFDQESESGMVHVDGKVYFDLNKKRFSDLPLYIRNTISNFKMSVYYFDDLTMEEEREMFKRLNAGKPLTTKERNIANCADIKNVMKLSETELIREMFTKNGIEKKNFVSVIMKIWMMCFNDVNTVSFESKLFNRVIEDARIDDEEMNKMNELFDFIVDVHQAVIVRSNKKTAKKLYTETHLVSVAPFMMKAMENRFEVPDVANWFISFFQNDSETSNSAEYNDVSKAGSARPESIKRRNAALEESYNTFFDNLESDLKGQDTEDVAQEYEANETEPVEFMNTPEKEIGTELESDVNSEEDEPLPEE